LKFNSLEKPKCYRRTRSEEKKALSPRRAYGLALKALGAANPRIVALDGDVT
jgi:hypothetical protein